MNNEMNNEANNKGNIKIDNALNKKICKNCGLIGEDKIHFYNKTKLCVTCFKENSKNNYKQKKELIKDKKNKKNEELINIVKEIKGTLAEVKKINIELKQELQEIKTHLIQN